MVPLSSDTIELLHYIMSSARLFFQTREETLHISLLIFLTVPEFSFMMLITTLWLPCLFLCY